MKKSKTVSLPKKSSDPSNSCVSDLLDLLAQINGGKPIELKVIAAIKEASSRFDGFGGIGRHHWLCVVQQEGGSKHHRNPLDATQLNIFKAYRQNTKNYH